MRRCLGRGCMLLVVIGAGVACGEAAEPTAGTWRREDSERRATLVIGEGRFQLEVQRREGATWVDELAWEGSHAATATEQTFEGLATTDLEAAVWQRTEQSYLVDSDRLWIEADDLLLRDGDRLGYVERWWLLAAEPYLDFEEVATISPVRAGSSGACSATKVRARMNLLTGQLEEDTRQWGCRYTDTATGLQIEFLDDEGEVVDSVDYAPFGDGYLEASNLADVFFLQSP